MLLHLQLPLPNLNSSYPDFAPWPQTSWLVENFCIHPYRQEQSPALAAGPCAPRFSVHRTATGEISSYLVVYTTTGANSWSCDVVAVRWCIIINSNISSLQTAVTRMRATAAALRRLAESVLSVSSRWNQRSDKWLRAAANATHCTVAESSRVDAEAAARSPCRWLDDASVATYTYTMYIHIHRPTMAVVRKFKGININCGHRDPQKAHP